MISKRYHGGDVRERKGTDDQRLGDAGHRHRLIRCQAGLVTRGLVEGESSMIWIASGALIVAGTLYQ